LLAIAGLLIIGITILSLRNLKLALLALTPEVTAVLVSLATLSLFGLSLNAPSIMAIIMVFGLTNSYGVFMVDKCQYEFKTNTPLSLFMAALTTIVGATVLLFARHPVLFSIGITLFSGLISGYLVSQLVVPILYRLWFKNKCVSY
jgi:predicted exporter